MTGDPLDILRTPPPGSPPAPGTPPGSAPGDAAQDAHDRLDLAHRSERRQEGDAPEVDAGSDPASPEPISDDVHLEMGRDRSRSPDRTTSPPHHASRGSIAPYWLGDCLRMAGDAAAPALFLRQREGKTTALSYSYQTAARITEGQSVEIDFVGYVVGIRGRRLGKVFEAIANQRALEVAECRSTFDAESEAPFIETISIIPTQER